MKLKFTGTCDLKEFQSRCSEHDFWYHSYYFDNGFVQRGDYDIGRDIDGYGFPEDMSGMSVLDVGTGSGWFATYFEQRGAEVTTLDVRGKCDRDIFGRVGYPDVVTEKPVPDRILSDGRPIYYSSVSKAFWIMKDLLGLRAEYVNARVYEICPELFEGKRFDLVFMGAVLMHLRDPIGALMAVRSVCRHRLIATSHLIPTFPEIKEPMMMMSEGASWHGLGWWRPNKPCLIHWFRGGGFCRIDVEKTVRLTVDKPFVDGEGRSSATNQTLALVNAYV